MVKASDYKSGGQAFDSRGIPVRCFVGVGTRIKCTSSGCILSIYVIEV